MPILEIRKFNSPVLRQRCQEVKEITEDIKQLISDMAKTMQRYDGVGLAASQVGELKRVIVVNPEPIKSEFFALINPRILKKSREKETGTEGCLSFPEIFLKIKRAGEIEVEGLDKNGKKIRISVQGYLARVLQHEIDHLDGILFFNRASFFQKIKFHFLKLKFTCPEGGEK